VTGGPGKTIPVRSATILQGPAKAPDFLICSFLQAPREEKGVEMALLIA
jgi:hypothetical protein